MAHCLGITTPDPLRLNLYFERFLNPARTTPPDIDTDLCSRRRDEVIRFVFERFGAERVAMVGTINRFRRRSALREVAKAYGLPPPRSRAMAEQPCPTRWSGPRPRQDDRGDAPYRRAAPGATAPPLHQHIFRDADALLSCPATSPSTPAAWSSPPGRMTDLVPDALGAQGRDHHPVRPGFGRGAGAGQDRPAGHPRPDRAGRCGRSSSTPAQPSDYAAPLGGARMPSPDDDPATADRVEQRRGRSAASRSKARACAPPCARSSARSADDLMVALALYRPGPLTGGLKDAFVRRFKGEEPVAHLHPALAPLLADTYGVILYQEQVLRIAHELAGFSLAEADLLRRAMSHFDPGKQMQTLQREVHRRGAAAQRRAARDRPSGSGS